MSQLNFPTNPTIGQQHTIGVNVWEWNGSAWLKLVPPRNIAAVFTVTDVLYVTSTTNSTNTVSGALIVTGGAGIGKNLYIGEKLVVESTEFDTTSTKTNNALYVKGGGYFDKSLVVDGLAIFNNAVIFNGTATYVFSTNTVYTDNLLNLHTPPGGVDDPWTFDDGKDIGFVFHNYYQSADNDSFLGYNNNSSYLEWYVKGTETIGGVFTGTEYGTFKTGAIILVNPITATNTSSGTLIVDGGAGISQDVYIGGNTLIAGNAGIGTNNPTSTFHVDGTTFITGITTITNITSATSTVTGALQVTGGVGIGQDVHIGGSITVGPTIDNTVVPSIYSNNFILSSYTSPAISSTSTQNLDSWSTATYRTVRYLVQITDNTNIHISEMTIFHAGGLPYLNEYGTNYNNGELGVFDADIIAGDMTLQFIPTTATNMIIKVVRMGITI